MQGHSDKYAECLKLLHRRNKPRGRTRLRWRNNTEIELADVELIKQTQDKDKTEAIVKNGNANSGPIKSGGFLE